MTALNTASVLANLGYKTLIIDFDPQGNLDSGIGIEKDLKAQKNIYNVLMNGENINNTIIATKVKNLDALPSTMDLAAFELEASTLDNREKFLKNAISSINNYYDYILIDCPPSLGMLTINSLVASDSILIPLQCEFFALEGLSYLLETAERIKENLNAKLNIEGILLTMYDKRNKLTEQVEKDARDCLGDLIFKTVIPRNVKLTESTSFGIPAVIYDKNCSGAIAYNEFAKEMVNKNDRK